MMCLDLVFQNRPKVKRYTLELTESEARCLLKAIAYTMAKMDFSECETGPEEFKILNRLFERILKKLKGENHG